MTALNDVPVLSFVDPFGVEWPLGPQALDAYGMLATTGVAGLGLPPRTLTADPNPRGGTNPRHIQKGARLVTLPVFIEGADHTQMLDRWRGLAEAMDATERYGPGQLVVYRPDGSRRITDCYYQDGFDHNGEMPADADHVVLTLYCPTPWWRAPDAIVIPRAAAGAAVSFYSPLFRLSSTQIFGSSSAFNPGGVVAWPTWTIKGPCATVVATNLTTGESWTFDAVTFRGSALTAAETVVIETDPTSITGPAAGAPYGANWTGSLNWPGARLWALERGDNQVSYSVSGSTSATAVDMSFYPRWASA